jgi:hypothetical protein
LTNAGSTDLGITAIALTASEGFSLLSTCTDTLAPGANCLILIQFNPEAPGALTASLNITDSAPGTTQSVALTGLYYDEAATGAATVSPSSLSFPGPASPAQTVTLTNTGGTPLGISAIILEDGVDYAYSSGCGVYLAPDGTCQVSVTFAPSEGGTNPSTLTFYDNAAAGAQVVALNPATVPAVTLTPGALSFASALSPAQYATLTNAGATALVIDGISTTDPADFPVSSNCASTLAAGTSCQISVSFTPATSGTFSALLSVTDGTPASTQSVLLTGDTSSGPGPGAGAAVSPSALYFVGSTTLSENAVLTNTGVSTLNITAIAAAEPTDFAVLSNCEATLAAGAFCVINVVFTPTADGTVTSTINITDSASTSPQAIALTGTSGPDDGPGAMVSPGALYFEEGSPAQDVTLSNTGTSALAISSITVSNPGSDTTNGYATSTTCGASLAAGASCTITVSQTNNGGTPTSTLSIIDNAVGSPQIVALSSEPPPENLSANPTAIIAPPSLAFFGSGGASQTMTLTDDSINPINILGIGLSSASNFSTSNNCPASLVEFASCDITVTFVSGPPSATVSASLILTDTALGSPQSVPLTGTNGPSAITGALASINPASLSFAGSGQPPQTATITNTGGAAMTISAITLTDTTNFSMSQTCPGSLAAGANCAITIDFTPSAAGTYAASVDIADNASGNPQAITLTGTSATATGAAGPTVSLGAASGGATSATVTSGQTATFNLQAAQSGGGDATVTLSVDCSSIPSTTCSASPSSITVSSTAAASFAVNVVTTTFTKASTPGSTSKPSAPELFTERELLMIVAVLLAVLLVSLVASRRFGARPARWIATVAVTILLAIACGCAGNSTGGTTTGGNGSGSSSSSNASGTPSGTYTVVVTASMQGVTQTLTLTLTVQ